MSRHRCRSRAVRPRRCLRSPRLGQHGRRPETVAGHEQAETQSLGLCCEGREQCPTFEDRPARVTGDRHEVTEQPRMRNRGDRVRLLPDPQYVVVVHLLWGSRDPELRRG